LCFAQSGPTQSDRSLYARCCFGAIARRASENTLSASGNADLSWNRPSTRSVVAITPDRNPEAFVGYRSVGLEIGPTTAHDEAMKSTDSTMLARSAGAYGLLAVCAILSGFGLFSVAVFPGFFTILLGSGMMATGGTAAYLIFSHKPHSDSHSQAPWAGPTRSLNRLIDNRTGNTQPDRYLAAVTLGRILA
jgi:hypothetical protein